jgi:hypothetical protein
MHIKPEQVSQVIWYEWSDDIVDYVENLLRKAIIKAERLKTLDLDDVL